jgi:hypothetical protein
VGGEHTLEQVADLGSHGCVARLEVHLTSGRAEALEGGVGAYTISPHNDGPSACFSERLGHPTAEYACAAYDNGDSSVEHERQRQLRPAVHLSLRTIGDIHSCRSEAVSGPALSTAR